ncbi:MAG: polysaccharide biosynthesis protein [Myxococcaceae bacterium]|nr:polysaccharide biosynthesis protein [Myxococcaceae bacterium]
MAGGSVDTNADMREPSQWLLRYRRAVSVGVHLALFVVAQVGSFLLRFEFDVPDSYLAPAMLWVAVSLVIRLVVFAWFGMFAGMWRYTGAKDLAALAKSATLSTLVFAVFLVLGGYHSYPRSILVIDFMLTMLLVGGLRFGVRSLWQLAATVSQKKEGAIRRVLIVGAGNAGEALVREMQKAHGGRYEVVGFADDDSTKKGARIHGVPVLGPIDEVPAFIERHKPDEVVIAIPSASGRAMRRIVELVKSETITIRTMPGIDQLIDGRVTINQLRSVNIEDLLGREPVRLDMQSIASLIEGRVVLVTGAGGSIGSELCRQVVRFNPSKLVLVERAENALFEIHRELVHKAQTPGVVPCMADITDEARMRRVFADHQPQVVLHAAAHKHVPMMEENPGEALKNNVGGTRMVANLADEFRVDRFVMISTDKAVNPTSVMGATKRVAELYIQGLSQRSRTRFVAVRFGNVLGSAGSVIPIFKEQIAAGGPVTVTHPEMKRYFMTIPEASQLVLQAATMGNGGEIFVLDMGEPVKIVDLARDLIRLSGLVPEKDIEIKFSGLRPGEKLFEELSTAEEMAEKTRHPKVFIGRLPMRPFEQVSDEVRGMLERANSATLGDCVERLRALVPELQRAPEGAAVIPLRRA